METIKIQHYKNLLFKALEENQILTSKNKSNKAFSTFFELLENEIKLQKKVRLPLGIFTYKKIEDKPCPLKKGEIVKAHYILKFKPNHNIKHLPFEEKEKKRGKK